MGGILRVECILIFLSEGGGMGQEVFPASFQIVFLLLSSFFCFNICFLTFLEFRTKFKTKRG